ncbi:MAG: zf-TFIIB domain-containing protein [Bdellovibrionaceae bacterium]|nr:zf-TFIIB domain-containing protein [Pseudobdellovibrionaceae bacterium]
MSEAVCPKCKGKFSEFKLKSSGVIVDVCQTCYSVWFDKDEFWTVLKNKEVKKEFEKKGLLNKKITQYKCPKSPSSNAFLYQGILPQTQVTVEHCPLCNSFLFDDREYREAKTQIDQSVKTIQSIVGKNNLKAVKEDDFSVMLFQKRLNSLNNEVYQFTNSINRPSKVQSVLGFFGRITKSFSLMLKEPEIILFSSLQVLGIAIGYVIWIQMLGWIPEEVWAEARKTDDYSSGIGFLLVVWGFICVGFAALPIGFFTACMGAVHLLKKQGKESTILRCCKFVFPKIWQLWVFSWLDGWITVNRILERLPSKNDKRTFAERAFQEAMYYAWKVGTSGAIPSLLTTGNTWQACKNSFAFLKHKTWDIMKLRIGYSLVSWLVGITAYIGSVFVIARSDLKPSGNDMYDVFVLLGFPIIIAVAVLKILIRPLYILSLFDIYSDYMIHTKQKILAPQKNSFAQSALWFFILLVIVIFAVILFRGEIGLTERLSAQ